MRVSVRWWLRAVAVVAVLAMVAAACGGDSSENTSSGGDGSAGGSITDSAGDGSAGSGGPAAGELDGGADDGGAPDDDGAGDDDGAADADDGGDVTDGDGDATADDETADDTDATAPTVCTESGAARVGGAFPTPAVGDRLLADARLGTRPGFDRFVLEFSGDLGTPPTSYTAQWSEVPVLGEGSGEPLVVAGDWYLEFRVAGASLYDFVTDTPYSGPTRLTGATSNVQEAVSGGEFESYMVWAIGAQAPTGFRVLELTDPGRLVVDVCVGGPTFESEAVTIGETCPTEPIADGASFGNVVFGDDVDGDGTPDTVTAFRDPGLDRWVLSVEPGIGGRVNLVADHGSGLAPGTVIGSADIDDDGRREIFMVTDVGARAEIISVASFSNCVVRWIPFENGAPATFFVTGGLFDAAAVTCVVPEGQILQEIAVNLATDPTTGEPISWTLEATPYELVDGVLVDVSGPPNPDPPFIESPTPPLTAAFNCAGLTS